MTFIALVCVFIILEQLCGMNWSKRNCSSNNLESCDKIEMILVSMECLNKDMHFK